MESTSYVERLSAFWASSVLLSIGPMHWAHLMEPKFVVVRRFDAFPSLPGIVPHRKKERILPLGTGARTTTPNVTHPPPTYRLGGTSEIQLR